LKVLLLDESDREIKRAESTEAGADPTQKRYNTAQTVVDQDASFEGVFSTFGRQKNILRTALPKLEPHTAVDCLQTIDLRTGECTPHAPDFFFTEQLAEPYDPNARHSDEYKELEKLVCEWMCHDVDRINFFRDIVGYCTTNETREQKWFLMHGEGRNGKSLALQLISEALGSFATPLADGYLQRDCNDLGKHPTDTVGLIGKRFAYSAETSDKKLPVLPEQLLNW
jgi:phage/plasmid-associated DNA primase